MRHVPVRRLPSLGVPAVKIDRALIDSMVSLLTERCQSVVISSGDYQYDTVDEFIAHAGVTPNELKLRGSEPRVSLEFERSFLQPRLSADDSPGGEAVFHRLQELLAKKRRWVSYAPGALGAWVVSMIILQTLARLPKAWFVGVPVWQQGLLVLVLTLTPLFLSFFARSGYAYVIDLSAAATGSFWSRKKDDLLLLLVGAAVGVFVSWLFGR